MHPSLVGRRRSPGLCRQPVETFGVRGPVPAEIDSATGTRESDQVQLAFTEDLIGDAILAEEGVCSFGNLGHRNFRPGSSTPTFMVQSLPQLAASGPIQTMVFGPQRSSFAP